MNLSFATMPWWGDILSFLVLGAILAIVFAFIPAFACSDIEIHGETKSARADWILWQIITLFAVIGGYVLAFAILANWID